MLRTLLRLLPALLVGALGSHASVLAQTPAGTAKTVYARSAAPVFRHVPSSSRRPVVRVAPAVVERAPQRAELRHLKGR